MERYSSMNSRSNLSSSRRRMLPFIDHTRIRERRDRRVSALYYIEEQTCCNAQRCAQESAIRLAMVSRTAGLLNLFPISVSSAASGEISLADSYSVSSARTFFSLSNDFLLNLSSSDFAKSSSLLRKE